LWRSTLADRLEGMPGSHADGEPTETAPEMLEPAQSGEPKEGIEQRSLAAVPPLNWPRLWRLARLIKADRHHPSGGVSRGWRLNGVTGLLELLGC